MKRLLIPFLIILLFGCGQVDAPTALKSADTLQSNQHMDRMFDRSKLTANDQLILDGFYSKRKLLG